MIIQNRIRLAFVVPAVFALLAVGTVAMAQNETNSEGASIKLNSPESRSFHLGFTTWAMKKESQVIPDDAIAKTLAEHGDLIGFHEIDNPYGSIPWLEALAEKPYPAEFEEAIAKLKGLIQKDQKVYVGLTPLALGRNVLKKLPAGWEGKDFDDPDVITAYTNYCRRMIREFKPSYFAYGVEVNMLAISNPPGFDKFLVMAKSVYEALKKENPELPVFLTFQIDIYHKHKAMQQAAIEKLLPLTDYIAVSSYPFMEGYENPEKLPATWFSEAADWDRSKPFAIAECGYAAENVDLKMTPPMLPKDVHIAGSEAWQAAYVRFLLEETQRLNGKFVIWFFAHDFDAFFDSFKEPMPGFWEFAKWWKDCGLVDGQGKPRESLNIWDAWLNLPHAQGGNGEKQ